MSFPSPLTVKVARSEQDSEGALGSRATEGHRQFDSISDPPHHPQHQLAKATMAPVEPSGRKGRATSAMMTGAAAGGAGPGPGRESPRSSPTALRRSSRLSGGGGASANKRLCEHALHVREKVENFTNFSFQLST